MAEIDLPELSEWELVRRGWRNIIQKADKLEYRHVQKYIRTRFGERAGLYFDERYNKYVVAKMTPSNFKPIIFHTFQSPTGQAREPNTQDLEQLVVHDELDFEKMCIENEYLQRRRNEKMKDEIRRQSEKEWESIRKKPVSRVV